MKYFQTNNHRMHQESLDDVKEPKPVHFCTGMERLALPPAAASPREETGEIKIFQHQTSSPSLHREVTVLVWV